MGNSTSCPAEHHLPEDPKGFVDNGEWFFKAHQVGWIVAGFFATIATIASAWLIRKHLQFYHNPGQQRHIVRILFMVPIYAIVSWLSYFFWEQALYFELLRDCYEAVVITAFFYLLIVYIGDSPTYPHPNEYCDREVRRYFKAYKMKKWMWPLGFVKYRCKNGLYFLQLMKWCILQYSVLRPLCTLASVVGQYFGWYCLASWSPKFIHLWSALIVSISVTVAMYCVLQLYSSAKEPLKPYSPILKFLAVKAVVFLTFWQVTALSMLITLGWLKNSEYWTAEQINIGIAALLQCIEMTCFAFLHIKAFTYLPYRPDVPASKRKEEQTSQWKAIKHVLDFRDVFREIIYGSKYMVGSMKGKDMDRTRNDDLEDAFGYERKDGHVYDYGSDDESDCFDEKIRAYDEDQASEAPTGMSAAEAKEFRQFSKKQGLNKAMIKKKKAYDPNYDEPSLTAIERDLLDAKARTGGDDARKAAPGGTRTSSDRLLGSTLRNATGTGVARDSYRFDPMDPRRSSRRATEPAQEPSRPRTADSDPHRYHSAPTGRAREEAEDHYREQYGEDGDEGRWDENDPLADPAARMMGFNGPRTKQKETYESARNSRELPRDRDWEKFRDRNVRSKKEGGTVQAKAQSQKKSGWFSRMVSKLAHEEEEDEEEDDRTPHRIESNATQQDARTIIVHSEPPTPHVQFVPAPSPLSSWPPPPVAPTSPIDEHAPASGSSPERQSRIQVPVPPPSKATGPPPLHRPTMATLPNPLAEPVESPQPSSASYYPSPVEPPQAAQRSSFGQYDARPSAVRQQSAPFIPHGNPYGSVPPQGSRHGSMPVLPHPSQLYPAPSDDRFTAFPNHVVVPLRGRERADWDRERYDPESLPLHLARPNAQSPPMPTSSVISPGSAYPDVRGSGSRGSPPRGTRITEYDLVTQSRRTSAPPRSYGSGSASGSGSGSGGSHRPSSYRAELGRGNGAGVGLRRLSNDPAPPPPRMMMPPPMPMPPPGLTYTRMSVTSPPMAPPNMSRGLSAPIGAGGNDRTRAWAQQAGTAAPPPPGRAAFVFEDY